MDPVSIIGATATLIQICAVLMSSAYTFKDEAGRVGSTLQTLQSEVESLSNVSQSINASFSDPSMAEAALAAQTGHEAQHWTDVCRSLDDCTFTLVRLKEILDKFKGEEGSVLGRPWKQIRLSMKSGEIGVLRNQITSCTRAMQISLQMINLSSTLANRTATSNFTTRLDVMAEWIQKLLHHLQSDGQVGQGILHSEPPPSQVAILNRNREVTDHLKACLVSAGRTVSAASSMVWPSSRESSRFGSDFGEALSLQGRSGVEDWLPGIDPIPQSSEPIPIDADTADFADVAEGPQPPSQDGGEEYDSDIESDMIRGLYTTAQIKFEGAEYAEAETSTRKVLDWHEERPGTSLKDRDEMYHILAVSCCKQGKWDDAERLLVGYIRDRPPLDKETLRALHALAEICFAKKALDNAEYYCKRAAQGRKRTLGHRNDLFLSSIKLVIKICEAKGDTPEAQAYRTAFFTTEQEQRVTDRVLAASHPETRGYGIDMKNPELRQSTLFKAVEAGNIFTVRVLLGSDVEVMKDGKTLFQHAVINGSEPITELLLERGADFRAKTSENGETALHLATRHGHTGVVRILLAQIDATCARTKDESTVVNRSAIPTIAPLPYESQIFAPALRLKKDDIDEENNHGYTALHLAAQGGCIANVQLLLQHDANIDPPTPNKVPDAYAKRKLSTVFGHGEEYTKEKQMSSDRPTPLEVAARNGHAAVVQLLLKNGAKVRANTQNEDTLLHQAVRRRDEAMTRVLVNHGVELDVLSRKGFAALHLVGQPGDITEAHAGSDGDSARVAIAQLLLDGHADMEIRSSLGDKTPLHEAALNGSEGVVRLLLGRADGNSKGSAGRTLLHYASRSGNEAVVRLLLDEGADDDLKDSVGRAPLHYAAGSGSEEVVRLLLGKGADVNSKDNAGNAPLHLATHPGSEAVVRLLLDKGADVNSKNDAGQTLLHYTAQSGSEAMLRLLLDKGAHVDSRDNAQDAPLHFATSHSNNALSKRMRMLLNRKADVNATNANGTTALHQAAHCGDREAIRVLLASGADCSLADRWGRMAHHYAADQETRDLIRREVKPRDLLSASFRRARLTGAI